MSSPTLLLQSPNWKESDDGKIRFWSSIRGGQKIPEAQLLAGDYGDIPGDWAAVIQGDNGVTLVEDRNRSRPLLYAKNKGGWVVSDSPQALRSQLPEWKLNREQAGLFLGLGHTLDQGTLMTGVRSVESGSSVLLPNGDGAQETEYYGVFLRPEQRIDSAAEFETILTAALDEAVGGLIERANGREIVLPLSGGAGSRLLATWLKRLEAPNVTTFTYGVEERPQMEAARQTAEQLDLPWVLVPYLPQEIRDAWFSEEADAFLESAWSGTSLPQVHDWWALRELQQKGLISEDAILVPGHTIIAAMHDEDLLSYSPSVETITQAAMRQQCLQGVPSDALQLSPAFRLSLHRAMLQTEHGGDPAKLQTALEWFKLREQHGKYVNNTVRNYEHFGWEWSLPLSAPAIWDAWSQGSQELTATRAWYEEFVENQFAQTTGVEEPKPTGSGAAALSGMKKFLSGVSEASGIDRILAKRRFMKLMMDHPLGLQAFVRTESLPELLGGYMMGQTITGIWAQSFLDNKWGSGKRSIVPTPGGTAAQTG